MTKRNRSRRKRYKPPENPDFERLQCACGKSGYRSEPIALQVLEHVRNEPDHRHSRGPTPIRVYQCPLSEWWHLTSAPKY